MPTKNHPFSRVLSLFAIGAFKGLIQVQQYHFSKITSEVLIVVQVTKLNSQTAQQTKLQIVVALNRWKVAQQTLIKTLLMKFLELSVVPV